MAAGDPDIARILQGGIDMSEVVSVGKDAVVQVSVNGSPVKLKDCRSVARDTSRNTVDVSVIGTDWKKWALGQRQWSGSLEILYDPTDESQQALIDAMDDGTTCELTFLPFGEVVGKPKASGTALITSLSEPFEMEDAIKITANFQGHGPLTKGVVA